MSLPTFAAAIKNSRKRQRYMKKIMFLAMLIASGAVITGCSKDDPFTESENYGGNSWNNGNIPGNGSNTPGGLGVVGSTVSGGSSVSLSSYSGGNGMGGGPGGWR